MEGRETGRERRERGREAVREWGKVRRKKGKEGGKEGRQGRKAFIMILKHTPLVYWGIQALVTSLQHII